ncbi:hypothetical protein HD806DRAFT_533588 [Xylariaceae sp. AK1471]|nr:hypothetical protein HD806DRAFT_533588 [Xylariaceae sp. AK1471]
MSTGLRLPCSCPLYNDAYLLSPERELAPQPSAPRYIPFRYKPENVGAIRPMNTLSNNKITSRTPFGFRSSTQSSSQSSSRAPPSSPPPSKRQKLDESNLSPTHSHAVFALTDGPSEPPIPRKRSIGSVSITDSQRSVGSNKSATRGMIPEYHEATRFTNQRRKRPRTKPRDLKPPRQEKDIEDPEANFLPPLKSDEEISEDEDEVDLINPQKASTGSHPQKREQSGHRDIFAGSRHFKKGSRLPNYLDPMQTLRKVIDEVDKVGGKMKHQESDGSPDELALNPEEIPTRQPAKRRRELPPSLSKKGDIQRTQYKGVSTTRPSVAVEQMDDRMREAELIIGNGLRIVRGASGQCLYHTDYDSDPKYCFLSVREISHTLLPVDQHHEILKPYTYLTLNLSKARAILRASDADPSCIVAVNCDSTDLSNSAGPKLMVEFATSQEWSRFLEWVAIYKGSGGKLSIRDCSRTKLEAEFSEMTRRAKSHRVIRDDETKVVVDDDIKVIQHNQDSRVRKTQKDPYFATESGSRYKPKDAMKHSISRPSGDDLTSSQSWDDQQAPASRQARTTRSTFALIESPEPHEPEPEGWTSLNPGWEKNWRNSLVFPNKGKNRATVDKDDIQRLDEGQFLNDNIIIFYLRVLQQKLEAEKPDLAQRIYFHNTFFYDKLKPTKSGQGINYDSVKAWTSKVDLFSKDYIIVPINEYTHWYVAIICNAPKLVPSSDSHEQADDTKSNVIAISDDTDVAQKELQAHLPTGISNGHTSSEHMAFAAQDVVENLRRMSIDSSGHPSGETEQKINNEAGAEVDLTPFKHGHEVHVIKDSDRPEAEVEHIATATSSQNRKKAGKRQSIGVRKCDPSQPRIITLDSLGAAHSPTCSYLRQYLIAELEDKKRIKIPNPGSIGTTAKDIPEQTNHCDCGLFLLGYIQEFLNDPDTFVKSLLLRDGMIPWSLDPSELRNNIRDLIFHLQEKQQQSEDAAREHKRQVKMNKPQTKLESMSRTAAPVENISYCPSDLDLASQDCRGDKAGEGKVSLAPPSSRPSSSRDNNSTTLGEAMDRKHCTISGRNAKDAITKVQLSTPSIHHDSSRTTRQVETGDRLDVEGIRAKPETDLHAVTPRKTKQSFDHEAHHHIPGAFPISPVEAQAAKHHSPSPSHVSQTPSSKGSRGAILHDPVIVDDSDNNRRDGAWQDPQRHRGDGPAPRLVVEIPSSHTHSQPLGRDGKADGRKQSRQQSSYFANRQDGERVTAARLRENPRNDVIDLSED